MRQISRCELEEMLSKNIPPIPDNIWIWGTGNTAQLYQEGLYRTDIFKTDKFKGFCDGNSEKWGNKFNGKTIVSPTQLKSEKDILVLICSPTPKTIREIRDELEKMHIEHCLIEEAVLKWNRKSVLKAYDLLLDEVSKNVYANIVHARINGMYPEVGIYSDNQYFLWNSFSKQEIGNIFVDCGSYVGDSLEKYIWKKEGVFEKIIAFEPDLDNYSAMQNRIKRLCSEWNLKPSLFQIFQAGVGEKNSCLNFERNEGNHGLGSKFIETDGGESDKCFIYALDEIISEKYTFLKADIESYEYKMLLGAKNGIEKWKPMLAVAIYHNAIDFFEIILLLKQIVPEYSIVIRHHSATLAETILYAWCEQK